MIGQKLMTIFGLILLSHIGLSQDLIILKNGEEVLSKITEVNDLNIKYKKFSNLDGPIYSIRKSEVFMLKYENGEKDIFQTKSKSKDNGGLRLGFFSTYHGDKRITKREMKDILKTNPKAYVAYREGRNLSLVGMVILVPSAFIFGWQLGAKSLDEDENYNENELFHYNETLFVVSGVSALVGVLIGTIGDFKRLEGISIYNKEKADVSFMPIALPNQLGLSFNMRF